MHAFEGDGAGWTHCARGHRHWGLFGAAGVLVTRDQHVLLQHRAAWTHEGDTWSIPGGALDSHEDALTGALREAAEETSLLPADLTPYAQWRDEHGGWSYTTVLAAWSNRLGLPSPVSTETAALAWWPVDEVDSLALHTGFRAAWPSLRELIR